MSYIPLTTPLNRSFSAVLIIRPRSRFCSSVKMAFLPRLPLALVVLRFLRAIWFSSELGWEVDHCVSDGLDVKGKFMSQCPYRLVFWVCALRKKFP